MSRAAVLSRHAVLLLDALHLHHSGEDELLWPKLVDRCRPDAELVHRMQGQHERVELHTERLRSMLPRWQTEARPAVGAELAATVDALRAELLAHLDEEERHVLPLAAAHVSQQEWDELGEHDIAKMSRSQLPLLFGMILEEADPEETAALYAGVPAPLRLLTRLVFLPRYRRYVKRVRGAG